MNKQATQRAAPVALDGLPEPLTPPDCDLRDFGFMKLKIEPLLRSKGWALARRDMRVGFPMMNLWLEGHRSVPAGSIPYDDIERCDLARCEPAVWPEIRDTVMHGWVLCRDGRFYHRFLCEEIVLPAWEERMRARAKGRGGADARWGRPRAFPGRLGELVLALAERTGRSPDKAGSFVGVLIRDAGGGGEGERFVTSVLAEVLQGRSPDPAALLRRRARAFGDLRRQRPVGAAPPRRESAATSHINAYLDEAGFGVGWADDGAVVIEGS